MNRVWPETRSGGRQGPDHTEPLTSVGLSQKILSTNSLFRRLGSGEVRQGDKEGNKGVLLNRSPLGEPGSPRSENLRDTVYGTPTQDTRKLGSLSTRSL